MIKKFLLMTSVSLLPLSACSNEPISTSIPEEVFTVRWLNYNGDVLEKDEGVPYGATPTYDGTTPKRESNLYKYTFNGWDPAISKVTSNIDYTATFLEEPLYVIPEPSHQSGFYSDSFELSFKNIDDFNVYYTLNYDVPSQTSTMYSEPILIKDKSLEENYFSLKENISSLDVFYPTVLLDKCTTLRVLYINKNDPSIFEYHTFTYFVNFNEKDGYDTLPIVSLSTEEKNLYDYETGIYVTGKIYDESPHEGYPETYPANYRQKGKEWERVSHLSYFNEDKQLEFEQEIGIRIHGDWSRAFAQKSFNLYARKEYDGNSKFKKAFFEGIKPHSLMLRAGGYRDTFYTKVRDTLAHDLSKDESFDVQLSKPCILFLNGEYWGIYNLQERYSDNYLEEHHNVDKKNILIVTRDGIDEGKEEDYHLFTEWVEFFENNSFISNEKYQEAISYLNPEEFAQYMSTQLYIGNIDWPVNNQRSWREVSGPNIQWHFMMYDTDDSMSMVPHMCRYDKDPFLKNNHWAGGPLEPNCLMGLLLTKLIENNSFKSLFRETYERIGSENFSSENVNNYLDKKVDLLKTPMIKQYQRFVSNSYDDNYFVNQVDVIKTFFENRYTYAMSFLNEHIPE